MFIKITISYSLQIQFFLSFFFLPHFTPVKLRREGGGVLALTNMTFGLVYVFWVTDYENWGIFREIFAEHP